MAGKIAEFFTDLLTRRPLAQASHNFLRGLHFHKDYFEHQHFSAWKGSCFPPAPDFPGSFWGYLSPSALVQTSLAPVPLSLFPELLGVGEGTSFPQNPSSGWQGGPDSLPLRACEVGALCSGDSNCPHIPVPTTFPATKLDGCPNELTPMEPYLCLLDVGYLINTSCPPLLRPMRDVDLIVSLDYNLQGAFQVGQGSYWPHKVGKLILLIRRIGVGVRLDDTLFRSFTWFCTKGSL